MTTGKDDGNVAPSTSVGAGNGAGARKIAYDFDEKGNIILPSGQPFDGSPVLIRTNTGWVEAWWEKGERTEDHEGNVDYNGFCWVCYDDKFQAELDDALEWMTLPPSAPALSTETAELQRDVANLVGGVGGGEG